MYMLFLYMCMSMRMPMHTHTHMYTCMPRVCGRPRWPERAALYFILYTLVSSVISSVPRWPERAARPMAAAAAPDAAQASPGRYPLAARPVYFILYTVYFIRWSVSIGGSSCTKHKQIQAYLCMPTNKKTPPWDVRRVFVYV